MTQQTRHQTEDVVRDAILRRLDADEPVTVRQLVDDLGLRINPEDFARIVASVVISTMSSGEPDDAAQEFDEATRAALERSGADFSSLPNGVTDPVERTRVAFAALVADAVTVGEAATALDRDASRIRQRIRERTLYAVREEDGWRLPRAQFEVQGGHIREIAGLGRVLASLPAELHPVAVFSWLNRRDPDLRLDGEPVTPRDWLRAGGDEELVSAIASDLLTT